MRVISGKYEGRKLKGFDILGTRPTMDRVKESLFGIIQNYITDKTCLDLFAGTGALGIEALSMGAKECYFVDNNSEAIHTKNKFDIIFLDPPYKNKLLNKALRIIDEYDLLNENGLVICEYEDEDPVTNLNLIKEKKYGDKHIKIFN